MSLYKAITLKLVLTALFFGCSVLPKDKAIKKPTSLKPISKAELDFIFLKSQLLIYSGEVSEALQSLDQVLSQKDSIGLDTSELSIMAARIELQNKNYFAASKRYEDLLSEGHDDLATVQEVARFYYLSEQNEKALELYTYLVKEDPSNENHWIYKGLLHTEAGDFDQAWDAFGVLTKESSQAKHLGYYYLAKLMRGVGDIPKSVSYYKKCISNKGDFSPCTVDLSEIYILQSKKTKAISLLKDFTSSQQDEAVLKKLTSIHLKNGDFKKASEQLFSLERLAPQDMDVKRKLAMVLIHEENYMGAMSRLKIISKSPSASEDDFLNTIRVMELTEGEKQAFIYTNQIIKNKAVTEKTFFKHYELNKRLNNNLNKGCEGLAVSTTSDCFYSYGVLFMSESKVDKAENFFKKALLKNKKNFKARYLLGRVYEDYKKDTKSALVEIKKSLEINPNYSAALNYLAYTWAKENRKIDTAVNYIQRALAQNPNSGQFLDTYGYLLYRQKKYQSALVLLAQAAKKIPNNPEVYEHLADVHFMLKDSEKALRFYKLASQLFTGEDRKRVGGKVAQIEEKTLRSVSSTDINSSSSSSNNRMPAAIETNR